jgi:hypothetical protein
MPGGRKDHLAAEARKAKFIQLVRKGATYQDAADDLGISIWAIRKWMDRESPTWVATVKAARREGRQWRDQERERRQLAHLASYDTLNHKDASPFEEFRQNFLGYHTWAYQSLIVDAIEKARPGEVTLVLIPPEHGKTTLLEDWCTYKLATDPTFRITVASETEDHGIKILARVRNRLDPDGPTPQIAEIYGPLAPEQGGSRDQVWGQKRFDTAQKRASDERDYSMSAVGITGRVQGTRCDLLLLDDMQDVKSLSSSERYFEILKQSFLSRPSMFGRTVIIGTRVGEYDVYRLLKDAKIPDHIIQIGAYNEIESPRWDFDRDVKPKWDEPDTWAPVGMKFLWPEMFGRDDPGIVPATPEDPEPFARFRYAALRFRVGESAWWRNYMQKPEAASAMTFDDETTAAMEDELRSVITEPRLRTDGSMVPVGISLDPAIGSRNAIVTGAMHPEVLEVLNVRVDEGLAKYGQIFDILEEECHRFSTSTSWIELVIVEDKAFQRGILAEDRMDELQRRFGFRVVPNTTGKEKTDKDIGVPSMEVPMRRGEITMPWADEVSRKAMEPLLRDLHIWVPGVDGTKLPQDCVMALWFLFRKWRGVRHTAVHAPTDPGQFQSATSPLRTPRPRAARARRAPYRSLSTNRRMRGHSA